MRTIAITGGKGGVGKTSIATGLCMALSQSGSRTTLFDADLGLANVDVVLGLRSSYTLQHVMNDEVTLREALHEGPAGIKVATGASGVAGLVSAGPKKLQKFFTQIFAIESETDYLVFDTGSGIDRRVMAFLRAADDVVVVLTPDAASMTDGYATIKAAFRANKMANVHVVVNMVESEAEADRTFHALHTIVRQFLKKEISFLGAVHADKVAAKCIRNRKPFFVEAPKTAASLDVAMVASRVKEWGPATQRAFSDRIAELYDAA